MFQDIKVSEDLNSQFKEHLSHQPAKQNLADSVSIKILNVAAWARTTDKVPVTLPRELEDYIPEVEEFYKVCNSVHIFKHNFYLNYVDKILPFRHFRRNSFTVVGEKFPVPPTYLVLST